MFIDTQNEKSIQNGAAASSTPSKLDEPTRIELTGTVASKSEKPTSFDWWCKFLIPATIPVAVAVLGTIQFIITTNRQNSDSEEKEIEAKEQVLTDYGKTIQELFLTKNNLGSQNGQQLANSQQTNMARGQTLIALRRLNPPDKNEVDESKIATREPKGLLIRFLYEDRLIDRDAKVRMKLEGADIDFIGLEDAWVPEIDLSGAWLRHGNFKNPDLTGANLSRANLTGADLRFAQLRLVQLSAAKLKGACYVKGKEAEYFPSDFNPTNAGMIPIDEGNSNPNKPNYERCPAVL